MEEKDIVTSEEEVLSPEEETPAKPMWQQTKEGWYDKVPLTVKQLDMIIVGGIIGLVITFLLIALDAMGVF